MQADKCTVMTLAMGLTIARDPIIAVAAIRVAVVIVVITVVVTVVVVVVVVLRP